MKQKAGSLLMDVLENNTLGRVVGPTPSSRWGMLGPSPMSACPATDVGEAGSLLPPDAVSSRVIHVTPEPGGLVRLRGVNSRFQVRTRDSYRVTSAGTSTQSDV